MAFATGRSSESSFKRYIGTGSFQVVAVNPTAAQLSEIYNGREVAVEPNYTGTSTAKDKAGNDVEVSAAYINVYLKSDPEKNNGIEGIFRANFTILNTPWFSVKNGVTKAQIIDEYGRTTWATLEDIAAKKIPMMGNGKLANISKNYRMAYRGEAELTEFVINLLNIPNVQTYNRETKEWSMVSNPKNSEARFEQDDIKAILKGKFDTLRSVFTCQPNNHIKAAIGVQTSSEGKLYQVVYVRKTCRNGAKTTDAIYADIKSAIDAGGLKNVEYLVLNESGNLCLPSLQEYSPAPTSFAQEPSSDMPESTYDGDDADSSSDTSDDEPFEF